MQDDIVPRSDNPQSQIPLTGVPDATAPLEPLAVPLARFKAILIRNLLVIIVVFVAGVGLTTVLVKRMPLQYSAEATLLIEPQRTQVSDLQAISSDPGDIANLVRTQIDILRAPALALGVVKALRLTDYPEFSPQGGGIKAALQQLLQKIGILHPKHEPPPTLAERDQMAASILNGKVGFANEPRSSVLGVSVTTQSAALSAEIANEIAKRYLAFKLQEKFAAVQRAHDWFQGQLSKLADQVSDADQLVEQYRHAHGLEDQPTDSGNAPRPETVGRQQLDEITRQLSDVSRERALKEGQLAQAMAVMHGDAPAEALPQVLASPVITQLAAEISAVSGREAQLASVQGPSNPELVQVRAQLRKLQLRNQQEMANVVDSVKADVAAARAQEQLLRNQMEHLRNVVSRENDSEVDLRALLTKARATRSVYESFLNRATELANVAGIQEPDASLVSSAEPPLGPSAPRLGRLVVVAALLSLVLGVALACAIERLRKGFTLPEQVEATLGLPMIALLPRLSRATMRGKKNTPTDIVFNAALNKLRGQLRTLGEQRPRLILVTSALPQEGKSVFASGLARNAAAAGWRVMLIECDFGRPSLANNFKVRAAPGLSDILAGDLLGDAKDVVQEPEPRLHVITAGRTKRDSQEMLASARMAALLTASRERYDLVILDTPPVLPLADALVLARQADATLMVVHWEKTARDASQDALRLLRESRARILGAVMTRVEPRIATLAGGRMFYAFNHYDRYYLGER